MFIACKYEEIYSPELKDFVYVCDNAYSKEQILECEGHIIRSLDFDLTQTSSLRFLERYRSLS
jgi:G2/mitotic-specific cyclin-B, other